MTPGQITALRAFLVGLYAGIAAVLADDGISAGDMIALAWLSGPFIVAILLADWINNAPRREK